MSDGTLCIAAAQYPVEFLGHWQRLQDKLTHWVEQAVEQGAQLLVFPEYSSMELASLFGPEVQRNLALQLEALQDCLEPYRELHRRLASLHGVYILAGSFPVRLADSSYRNRAYLFGPSGAFAWQDKLMMTRFESEQWQISPGQTLNVFHTRYGVWGINICYDSEFPALARAQVEAGAQLLLVPSCTETMAGYWRVRIGSQARALENQCLSVQAALIGQAAWSEAVDINNGAAAIYAPPDHGMPADGVLAIGELNVPQWVIQRVDLAQVAQLRQNGSVLNWRDWSICQQRVQASSVHTIAL